jgi:hypothetical protein
VTLGDVGGGGLIEKSDVTKKYSNPQDQNHFPGNKFCKNLSLNFHHNIDFRWKNQSLAWIKVFFEGGGRGVKSFKNGHL